MLYPTIDELTKGKFNRYQLAIATAKCARLVTDEYVHQRTKAGKYVIVDGPEAPEPAEEAAPLPED